MVRDQLSWSHKTWVHIEVVGLVTQLVRSCFDHIINVWSTGLFLGWAQLALHCKSPVAYTYGRQVMHLEWWRCQTDLSQLQTVDVTAAVQTKPELRQPPISGGINFILLYCTVLASSHPTTKLLLAYVHVLLVEFVLQSDDGVFRCEKLHSLVPGSLQFVLLLLHSFDTIQLQQAACCTTYHPGLVTFFRFGGSDFVWRGTVLVQRLTTIIDRTGLLQTCTHTHTENKTQSLTCTVMHCCWYLLYSAVLHSQALTAFTCNSTWVTSLLWPLFWIPTEVVYLQHCLTVT